MIFVTNDGPPAPGDGCHYQRGFRATRTGVTFWIEVRKKNPECPPAGGSGFGPCHCWFQSLVYCSPWGLPDKRILGRAAYGLCCALSKRFEPVREIPDDLAGLLETAASRDDTASWGAYQSLFERLEFGQAYGPKGPTPFAVLFPDFFARVAKEREEAVRYVMDE